MEPNKPTNNNQPQRPKPALPTGNPAGKPTRIARPKQPGNQPSNGNQNGGKPRGSNFTPKGTRNRQQPKKMPDPNAVPVNKSSFANAGQPTKQAPADQARLANQPTREDKIRIIPLGGLGEIGKNMTAIEYGNDIVIMDMGFAFPDETQPGIDYIIPDTSYLEQNKHKVRAIIITHGHMDHIGGAGYIMPKFPVPVYGSRLSLAFVEKQISEFSIGKPDFRVMDPDKHEQVQIGGLNVELVRVTHTISDSTAIVLRTPLGAIINTGDWRNDPEPLDGRKMDWGRLEEISKEGVLLLMCDSTDCDRAGHGPSERIVIPTIDDLFSRAKGRIIISAFSTSITRVQMVIDATVKAGRKLALVGRSTLANAEICVRHGYIKIPPGLLVRVQDINTLKDNNVVVLSTGSQGEENSALVRMSTGDHKNIKIKPGDTIILSSSIIPGNEKAIVQLIDNLMREGAQVFARMTEGIKKHGPVHVGGHAFRDDVGDLISLVKPKYFMPIHGEFHHLVFSAEEAEIRNIPKENIFVMDNGDVLEITPSKAKRSERVPSGSVLIDGSGIGDVENVVLRDRLAMANEGIFVIVATVDRRTGQLVSSPDIISRGFIYMKDNEELVGKARVEIRKVFEKRNPKEPIDWAKFKLRMRDDISDFLYKRTKRNPMVITVINEV